MAIEEYLFAEERILVRCGHCYATNKRIIKYVKTLVGKEFHDLAYSRVSSLSLINNGRKELIVLGIIWLFIGVIIFLMSSGYGIVSMTLGVVLMASGVISKTTDCELRVAGLTDTEEESWRVSDAKSRDAKRYVTIIRENVHNGSA